jgi:4-carboxymuconolactone decarboxylase
MQPHNPSKKIVQTAGREALGTFAPAFAHYNDDVLFGENWNDAALDHRTRCLITVVALVASGITDSSLQYHLQNAKQAGVTREAIAAAITHTAFYAGWPKAWAAFNQAKTVWSDDAPAATEKDRFQKEILFPIGEPNDAFAQYFTGQSYLAPLILAPIPMFNVTFEPGCRNYWHIHRAASGGGQILICIGGRGFYQEAGKAAVELTPGKVVNIPPAVKHWHGAAADSWMAHIAVEVPGEDTANEWCEAVADAAYAAANA